MFSAVISLEVSGQSNSKFSRSFDEPWVTDSASTMLIPYRYDAGLFTSGKMMAWGDYYANYIVYDFKSDGYKTLFPADTYIQALDYTRYSNEEKPRRATKDWIFYLVKFKDHNSNGKIDEKDPFILFASDRRGANLKQITLENENVRSFTLYESLGFVLLKMQRDENNDREFKGDDNDHYMVKLNLLDLKLGNKIEYRKE
jgi:hypothetical protein